MHSWNVRIAMILLFSTFAANIHAKQEETFELSPFGKLYVYEPTSAPAAVVIFISGDGGWNEGVVNMARYIVNQGALVVGIDITKYYKHIQRSSESCFYPAGDLEQLSMTIQKKYKLKQYLKPILMGYSSGATLVYGALAQAPSNTFKGGISLGFCPDIEINKALCKGSGLTSHVYQKHKSYYLEPTTRLTEPFIILQGVNDQVCSFRDVERYVTNMPMCQLITLNKVGHGFSTDKNWMPQLIAAYNKIVKEPGYIEKRSTPALQKSNSDIPFRNLPLSLNPAPLHRDLPLILFISGDGGWTNFDQSISEFLAKEGIPVVGLDAQRYFWEAKNPQLAASELSQVISHYMQEWNCKSIVIAGYSFGAGVVPFITNELPNDLKKVVRGIFCISPDKTADFEIHIADMLDIESEEKYNVISELNKLKPLNPVCIFGSEESVELKSIFSKSGIRVETLPGNHHFNDDYKALATTIIKSITFKN